jgi:hypothetical protein
LRGIEGMIEASHWTSWWYWMMSLIWEFRTILGSNKWCDNKIIFKELGVGQWEELPTDKELLEDDEFILSGKTTGFN